MIKKILSVTLVAISMVSIPMVAQNTNGKVEKCEKTEKCDKKEKCDSDCEKDKKANRDAKMLEGLTLTDAQKQQVADLNAKTRNARKAKAEEVKNERKQEKEAAKADRKAMKMQKEQERRAYLQEFRKIVGDDNYIIFLENQYIQKSEFDKPGMKKDARDGKMMQLKKEKLQQKGSKAKETARIHKSKGVKA